MPKHKSSRSCHRVRTYKRKRFGRIEIVRTHPRCCGGLPLGVCERTGLLD